MYPPLVTSFGIANGCHTGVVNIEVTYTDIVNTLAYRYKTDKAFAISGRLTNPFMKCKELVSPRVSKYEIKNIILGDGQKLLRPERRFDAYLVSHPELFTK